MIHGTVGRQKSTPLGTPGALALPLFACNTLELPWAGNQRGLSCILPDVYRGRVWHSPTFKRLVVRLEDKNGRADVLIHNANFAATLQDLDNNGIAGADLDGDGFPEVAQLRGCTAVGNGYGEILRKDGKMQWGIKSSGATLAALVESLRTDDRPDTVVEGVGYHDVVLTYSWAPGCAP